ncbi:MAG: YtxH domain-containing protein [Anaerolineales bacterium]|nr:YtxH domain-containing protein [Anaerolineales bacterium]
MRRFLSFLSGVLSGAVIGSALILLFTPYSGTELKKSLQERIRILQNEMRAAYEERKSQLETELEGLRQGHIVLKE